MSAGQTSSIPLPKEACSGCEAELQAWYAATATYNAAKAAMEAAHQAYMDCEMENGGGSGTPPRLKDSGESILVTTDADLSE
ncbi:MAG: hypothetical protein AAFX06_25550 [Planctomycetota bacterium]